MNSDDRIKDERGRLPGKRRGKRVDYSGRSVIVPDPRLRLHQCGLPKTIALELFRPFIARRRKELFHLEPIVNLKSPRQRKERPDLEILEEIIKDHPVLLSRPPMLHRAGIQAFEPVLVDDNAIHIHPLVCKGFNADFDGDQIIVHLPLSIEARVEATVLMMPTSNLFSPANGKPLISPSQDVVMGCYYLTATRGDLGESGEPGEGKTFAGVEEVQAAFAQQKLGLHARIYVRLPLKKKFITEVRRDRGGAGVEVIDRKPTHCNGWASGRVLTTVGRVLFNDILHPDMGFYDLTLSARHLERVLADCHEQRGRREMIELLDRIKELGFREATRSGLSLGFDDFKTPAGKKQVLATAEKQIEFYRRQFEEGCICETERYNKVIDLWTYARDEITKQMLDDLRSDCRDGLPSLNPLFLMAHSGARGGTEEIRQLAGMCGLVARPNGSLIETPIKASLGEGLNGLEYFSSTCGARRGLVDPARRTSAARSLLRKLAAVTGNVVVTMHDCGSTQGVVKSALFKGLPEELSLAEAIRGRVSCSSVVDPRTGALIVAENEMITPDAACKIEGLGLGKIQVRSPMTCRAPQGVCRLCYGMDLATGTLVEEGMAVGILAAHAIAEPGPQLVPRTFLMGGFPRDIRDSEVRAKRSGTVRFYRLREAINDRGERIALAHNLGGAIQILGPRDKVLESCPVPNGALLLVADRQQVQGGTMLANWDPHNMPILAEHDGKVRFEDLIENDTLRKERDDTTGAERWVSREYEGRRHPRILIDDGWGHVLSAHFLPDHSLVEVREGMKVKAGTLLARTPRGGGDIQDVSGGLQRVVELFEGRTPRHPAILAEVPGIVTLGEKKRGKRLIFIQPVDDAGRPWPSWEPSPHEVPPGKHLRVRTGERVKEGEPLVSGPRRPQDILRILGIEEVRKHLLREVQVIYRTQRLEVDDKHIEIVLAQMLRYFKVDTSGDTDLLPGAVLDKFHVLAINNRLRQCVKVKDPGASRFPPGTLVAREVFEEEQRRLEAEGKPPATFVNPQPALCSVRLLGITKAARRAAGFLTAALQDPARVLTEAALAGKVDNLDGLKENVLLGHLMPAGTGFRTHQAVPE